MEISGKIIVATEPRTGTSARTGSKWVAQDFVIETHEQYPKRCVFGVFGEDRLREFNINVGDELTVSLILMRMSIMAVGLIACVHGVFSVLQMQ